MILTTVYNVDISRPLLPTPLQQMLITKDKGANRIAVNLYNGQTPFAPGGSCVGFAVRRDGLTVPIENGVVSGSQMYIDLPADAYALEGPINIGIKNVSGGTETTVFLGMGVVSLGETDAVIDPGTIIPSVSALIAAIQSATASIPADYSALLATIAPNYSGLAFPVLAGTYCWYSGTLYQALQDIPTAESWTAAHWKEAIVGDALACFLRSPNILNPAGATDGVCLDSDGVGQSSSGYITSDFIPVKASTTYALRTIGYAVYYDSNKDKVGNRQTINSVPQTITTHSQTAYMRVSVNKQYYSLETSRLCEGSAVIDAPYYPWRLRGDVEIVDQLRPLETSLVFAADYAMSGGHAVTAAEMESGTWNYDKKAANSKSLRNKQLYPIKKGMLVQYDNPTLQLDLIVVQNYPTASWNQNSGWISAGSSGTFTANLDGYLIVLAKSENDITTADYDCTISITTIPGEAADKMDRFFVKSKNLLNPAGATDGVVISSDGTESSSVNYITSDYIPAKPSTTYALKTIGYAVYYDANFDMVGNRQTINSIPQTISAHSQTAYIRVSVNKKYYSLTASRLCEGSTITDEPYYPWKLADFVMIEGEDQDEDFVNLRQDVETLSGYFGPSKNLLNPANASNGVVIATDGTESESSTCNTTDYIPVSPSTQYTLKTIGYACFYNAEKEKVGNRLTINSIPQTVTSHSSAAYIRVSVNKNYFTISSSRLCKGTTITDEPYYAVGLSGDVALTTQLDPANQQITAINKILNTLVPSYGVPFMPSLPFHYTGDPITPQKTSGHLADVYALYDALLAQYPQFISKAVIGMDASEQYEIRSYVIHQSTNYDYRLPRIVWLASIHGNEGNTTYSTFYMVKELVEKMATDPNCYAIMSAVRVYVIPAVNPWGVENYSRTNANHVNLNRNFPADWVYRDPTLPAGTTKYGIQSASNGDNPYYYYGGGTVEYDDENETATVTYVAEPETQAIMTYINSINTGNNLNGKVCFAVNKHDAGPMSSEGATLFFKDNFESDRAFLKNFTDWMKPLLMATQGWLRQKNGLNLATVSYSPHDESSSAGTMDKWLNAVGIHGCLLEIPTNAGSSYTDTGHVSDLCTINVDVALSLMANVVVNNAKLKDNTQTAQYTIVT